MTREMAARILHPDTSLEAQEEIGASLDDVNEACRMGAEALRPWVRTADRVPTGKDTNKSIERGQVLARHLDGVFWVEVFWVETYVYISTYPDLCPYWTPIPPLPDHIADAGKKVDDHEH